MFTTFLILPLVINGLQTWALTINPLKVYKRGVVQSSSLQATVQPRSFTSSSSGIWYTDPDLSRAAQPPRLSRDSNCLFIILSQEGKRKISHLHAKDEECEKGEGSIKSVFLTYSQVEAVIGHDIFDDLVENHEGALEINSGFSLIWLGNHDMNGDAEHDENSNENEVQYWAISHESGGDLDILSNKELEQAVFSNLGSDNVSLESLPLREFGDQIIDYQDAAIYSMANGLIEFHKSHKFCSTCGSPTTIQKSGSSRQCSNSKRIGGSCTAPSIYPRIDVASIMLITSPCENYALLGRKALWPSGRYSTLAGFLEIGETLEECCARETLEESGVPVDKDSIRFIRSQPWPFPRSLMVGFQARATNTIGETSGNETGPKLPAIDFDPNEMEDVKWFHRDFVAQHLDGGSTAINYKPTDKESEFHIPGKASLARHLITSWALETGQKLI